MKGKKAMGIFKDFANIFTSEKKQKLLAFQNLVLSEPKDKLVMNEQQIKQAAFDIARRYVQIIDDTTKILDKTTDPEVFFSRLALLFETCDKLILFEPYLLTDKKWSEINNNFHNMKYQQINLFIVRYSEKVVNKLLSLKTNKAKKTNAEKFFNSLKPYDAEMNADNIAFYTKYYNRMIDSISE